MNTLIYYSFNIAILSVIILILGLVKPKWLFFWMDSPGRFPGIVLAMALFMAAATMFGEGNKELQAEKDQAKPAVTQPSAEVPKPAAVAPAPVPAPAPAAIPAVNP